MARYLVEPNEEEYLLFDLNREQEMVIIKSVFRKLVGYYTPLEEEDERIMNDEVGEVSNYFQYISINIYGFSLFICTSSHHKRKRKSWNIIMENLYCICLNFWS